MSGYQSTIDEKVMIMYECAWTTFLQFIWTTDYTVFLSKKMDMKPQLLYKNQNPNWSEDFLF